MSVGGRAAVESDEVFEFGLDALICGLREVIEHQAAAIR